MPRTYRGTPFDPYVQEPPQLNPAKLCIVHATPYAPKLDAAGNAYLHTTAYHTDYVVPRNTLHFALNHKVAGHMYGSWDDKPFALVGDFDSALRHNGKPIGFNTVDTCWDRKPGGYFFIPDATIVKPATEPGSLCTVIDDNTITYKNADYTHADTKSLIEGLERNDRVNQPEIEDVKKLYDAPAGISLPENQAKLRSLTNKLAVDKAIETRGYTVMEGGMHEWSCPGPLRRAFNPLFKELGAEVYQHQSSHYGTLENRLQDLRSMCEILKKGESLASFSTWDQNNISLIKQSGFLGFDSYVTEHLRPIMGQVSAASQQVAENCIRSIRTEYHPLLSDLTKAFEETRWQRLVESARNGISRIR